MISAAYYQPAFLSFIFLLTVYWWQRIRVADAEMLVEGEFSFGWMSFLCIGIILFLGQRPTNTMYFGDTINYARDFRLMQNGTRVYDPDSAEWLFSWMINQSSKVMDVHTFLTLVDSFYIIPLLLACRRLMPRNGMLAMLFVLGAFSFFTYGVNGIRNGMACSLIVLAFSYIRGTRAEQIVALLLCWAAYNIHHSTALPIVGMLIACRFTNLRIYMAFWLLSIFLSVVLGETVEQLFLGWGFDDRMDSYIQSDEYDDLFSNTGFRWDFLLYSSMPILLAWYILKQMDEDELDEYYKFLMSIYIFCNAFWIMIIRASFSNRFAYLSWFMYPIVLSYPLLKVKFREDQGRLAGLIMIGHILFTMIMNFRLPL